MNWLTSRIPRPYVVAQYPQGPTVVDERHVVYVDIEDIADLPIEVHVSIKWMTPRQHAALEEAIF